MGSVHRSRTGRAAHAVTLGVAATLALGGCLISGHTAEPVAAPAAQTATQPATAVSIGLDLQTVISAAVPAELTAFVKGEHRAGAVGIVGITVLDQTTGASVAINDQLYTQTASIVKVDILATRLLQHQQQGTSMTAHEKTLAFAMITQSDNDAASALFALDGKASGLAKANQTFGLTETTPNSSWGITHTHPADQLRLLKVISDPSGPLSASNQTYLLTLMTKVEAGQRWGVPVAAGPDATKVYVKNGWDTFDQFGDQWGINSIGRIVEPGHDWLVAALSRNNSSEGRAEKFLGALCALAVDGLRLETTTASQQ